MNNFLIISEQHFKDFEIQNALVDLFSDIGAFTGMDISESWTKSTLQNWNYDLTADIDCTRDLFLHGDWRIGTEYARIDDTRFATTITIMTFVGWIWLFCNVA